MAKRTKRQETTLKMLASSFKKTKIVATIGPASWSPQILDRLIREGMNMARLNLSHGTHEEHGEVVKLIRALQEKHEKPIAILADLQGPRIRVAKLPADGVPFVRGKEMRFAAADADYESDRIIPVQHDISKYLKPGERLFLRDGMIEVKVESISRGVITTRVVTPGILLSNQGINLPDSDMGGDILTEKDLRDIEFAVKSDADYIALSFVQTPQDVLNLKKRLARLGSDLKVIAKIETAAAVHNLEEVMAVCDGVMVARGDMATETRPELVPAVQRRMIELGRHYRIPVIVATQMLESMTQSPQPTRAEVSDVATAVLEGADAVMLSGETARGLFPVETVRMMKRILIETERDEWIRRSMEVHSGRLAHPNAISVAAVTLAASIQAKVIVAETASGQTARNISSLRPAMPIIMVTDSRRVYQQLALIWGSKSFYYENPETATEHVIRQLRADGNLRKGNHIVIASGNQPGVPGGTDTVSVRVVG